MAGTGRLGWPIEGVEAAAAVGVVVAAWLAIAVPVWLSGPAPDSGRTVGQTPVVFVIPQPVDKVVDRGPCTSCHGGLLASAVAPQTPLVPPTASRWPSGR